MHESLEPKMKESEQQNTVDASCGENHNDVADACQIGNREGYEVMENATIWPNNWLTPSPITPWFGREAPLHVDLGFGLGGFLCQMAAQHPEINFLGIERQLERMRKIDRRVAFRKLDNVRLMRIEAGYYLTYMLPEASVDVLYILFPDPWPKLRHQHERLLGPGFIDAIHRSLKPDGVVHFATDHLPYFHFATELVEADSRFVQIGHWWAETNPPKTDFERKFETWKPIGRYSFKKADR